MAYIQHDKSTGRPLLDGTTCRVFCDGCGYEWKDDEPIARDKRAPRIGVRINCSPGCRANVGARYLGAGS